jgi:hypothetical protein
VRAALRDALHALDAADGTVLTFPVEGPVAARQARGVRLPTERFHVAIRDRTRPGERTPRLAAAVAHVVDGRLVAVRGRVTRS